MSLVKLHGHACEDYPSSRKRNVRHVEGDYSLALATVGGCCNFLLSFFLDHILAPGLWLDWCTLNQSIRH